MIRMIKKRLLNALLDLLIVIIPSSLLIIADAVIKKWAYDSLYAEGGKRDFIKGFLGFRYAENTGAAWSILSDQPWIFISISVIMVILIFCYLIFGSKRSNILLRTSLILFFSGGVGNLIDRLFRTGSHFGNRNGFVVDMLNFEFIDFPIFNFADVCVCAGAGLFILYFIVYEIIADYKKEKQMKEALKADGK